MAFITILFNVLGQDPPVRDFHTATCINDKMYIFGGRGTEPSGTYSPDEETYSNELWYLDLNTLVWHNPQTTGDIPSGRRSHSACKMSFLVLYVYKYCHFVFSCLQKENVYFWWL